jgi:photosystem II stability/assembly factor-like uncharacterized protein
MSNTSDFFGGGGGGFPINSVLALNEAVDIIESNGTWLRSGVIETDPLVYPLANNGSYSVEGATYDSIYFSVSTEDLTPTGLAFNSDGTKMYIVGSNTDSVYQYTLTTAWDISTASYGSVSFSVSTEDLTPTDIAFNLYGTKMYIVGASKDKVYQYTLTTAWDISTASYDSVSFSISTQDSTPVGITFNLYGTKMYMVGDAGDEVYQYTLTTAWDISTASYDSVSFSISTQESTPVGITFSRDGTKMCIVGDANNRIYQYTLTTAWDISTATYDSIYIASVDSNPTGMAFNDKGTKMYIVGSSGDKVYQYTLTSFAGVKLYTADPTTNLPHYIKVA